MTQYDCKTFVSDEEERHNTKLTMHHNHVSDLHQMLLLLCQTQLMLIIPFKSCQSHLKIKHKIRKYDTERLKRISKLEQFAFVFGSTQLLHLEIGLSIKYDAQWLNFEILKRLRLQIANIRATESCKECRTLVPARYFELAVWSTFESRSGCTHSDVTNRQPITTRGSYCHNLLYNLGPAPPGPAPRGSLLPRELS